MSSKPGLRLGQSRQIKNWRLAQRLWQGHYVLQRQHHQQRPLQCLMQVLAVAGAAHVGRAEAKARPLQEARLLHILQMAAMPARVTRARRIGATAKVTVAVVAARAARAQAAATALHIDCSHVQCMQCASIHACLFERAKFRASPGEPLLNKIERKTT